MIQPQNENGLMTVGNDQMDALQGRSLQRIQTQYSTAMTVQIPRELAVVEQRLMQEADQAGTTFYYGWGSGTDRIEGPSVGLAMSAVRCWGNCAVEMLPVQETRDSWVFTAAFVDLETGFTLMRQFRQSKNSKVYGKHDEERKADIRFQIGQSKAVRNVVTNALPGWLIDRVVDRAKGGVRKYVEALIEEHTLESVAKSAVKRLSHFGVTEQQVLEKYGRKALPALTVNDLVLIRGDVEALEKGLDTVDGVYPPKAQKNGDTPPRRPDSQAGDQLADRLRQATTTADAEPQQQFDVAAWRGRLARSKRPETLQALAEELAEARTLQDVDRETGAELQQMVDQAIADAEPRKPSAADRYLDRIANATTIDDLNAINDAIDQDHADGTLTGTEVSALRKQLHDRADQI